MAVPTKRFKASPCGLVFRVATRRPWPDASFWDEAIRRTETAIMETGCRTFAAMLPAAFAVAAIVLMAGVATTLTTLPVAAAMKRGRDCSMCHTQPPQLNARGKAVKAKRDRRNRI
jgi:hypothetical protein